MYIKKKNMTKARQSLYGFPSISVLSFCICCLVSKILYGQESDARLTFGSNASFVKGESCNDFGLIGCLDNVHIFSRLLIPSEIQMLANPENLRKRPAYYKIYDLLGRELFITENLERAKGHLPKGSYLVQSLVNEEILDNTFMSF